MINNETTTNNIKWKEILFIIGYILCSFTSISFAVKIDDYVQGGNSTLFSPLVLIISLVAIVALTARYYMNIIFAEKAIDITKKTGVAFIFIGILALINLAMELGPVLLGGTKTGVWESIVGLIGAIFFVMLIVQTVIIYFILIALLRLSINRPLVVRNIAIISGILWLINGFI